MRLPVLKRKKLPIFFVIVLLFGLWYVSKTPSNDRQWTLDQQVLPYAEIAGDEGFVAQFPHQTHFSPGDTA